MYVSRLSLSNVYIRSFAIGVASSVVIVALLNALAIYINHQQHHTDTQTLLTRANLLAISQRAAHPIGDEDNVFSYHYCTGGRGRYGRRGSEERSCLFHHICYNVSSGEWLYYVHPEHRRPIYMDFGRIGWTFDNVNTAGGDWEQPTDAAHPNYDGFHQTVIHSSRTQCSRRRSSLTHKEYRPRLGNLMRIEALMIQRH